MGYEDDFYKRENLLGYTGSINGFPTVYFLIGEMVNGENVGPVRYGHITQMHNSRANCGRGEVRLSNSYKMMANDAGNLYEKDLDNGVKHQSRNKFVLADGLSGDEIELLMMAVANWPEEKLNTDMTREERREERGSNLRLMNEITIRVPRVE